MLEVMVALSIIAIVLVTVFQLHARTIAMNHRARFDATAPLLAQGKMAEIQTRARDDLGSDSGGFGEQYPGYAWRVDIEDVDSEVLGKAAASLKKIELVVSLNETELSYRLTVYRNFWK